MTDDLMSNYGSATGMLANIISFCYCSHAAMQIPYRSAQNSTFAFTRPTPKFLPRDGCANILFSCQRKAESESETLFKDHK
jgi:hypothetical protein